MVAAEHVGFLDSQGVIKERIGARVKIFEIAREKDDSERIAIAPFNLYFFSVDEHSRSSEHPAKVALAESIADRFRVHRVCFSPVCLR